MIGAIFGDIAGSRFEFNNTSDYNFNLYSNLAHPTDDSICTLAVADFLVNGGDMAAIYRKWCLDYPGHLAGYGGGFYRWIHNPQAGPYKSFGNGAVMRVSPVGWAGKDENEVLLLAKKVTEVSHNHRDGIKGAQAISKAIWRLRQADVFGGKDAIVDNILSENYPHSTHDWYLTYRGVFDETSQVTAPVALYIFKESVSFEDAIRKAVSFGGDCDTIGAVVGGLAEAYFGVTSEQRQYVKDVFKRVHREKYWDAIEAFEDKFGNKIISSDK